MLQVERPAWSPMAMAGRGVVVTGGASGIGLACTVRLAQAGARVAVLDVRRESLDAAQRDLDALGHGLVTVRTDVTRADEVVSAVAAAHEALGGIDTLVNNVGGMGTQLPQRFDAIEPEQWGDVVALNLNSVYLVTRTVLAEAGSRLSSIVNVGASLSERSSPHLAAYGAAKAAVAQLSRTLAVELGRSGIRVNCVAPGFTVTPASAAFVSEERRRDTANAVPLGRVAEAEELADVIVFLASEYASFVSGQTVVVDGGLTCTTLRRPRDWPDVDAELEV